VRVLIAEDDVTSRTVLTALLRKWGHDPVATQNGAQAVEVLQQMDAPLLLLLDWNMPEMNGLEVTRRVRAQDTSNPPYIILLTVRDETVHIVAGLDAGANDYMIKPYKAEELRARVSVGQRMLALQANLLEARNALAHQALHDPLTGVYNRRAIDTVLCQELARAQRENVGLAIGMCDIDHFKQVNDTHGHTVGDEALCAFVHRLTGHLREYDHLGRWGGEEFLVIAPGITENSSAGLYERLRAAVADNPIPTKAGSLPITVSIGVAVWSGKETVDELLSAADSALYQAKQRGRNCVSSCLADGRMVESASP
jgi:two-component system, cell cycle response regulator